MGRRGDLMTKAFDTWFLRKFLIFSSPSFAFHLENQDAIFCLGFHIAKSNQTDKKILLSIQSASVFGLVNQGVTTQTGFKETLSNGNDTSELAD